MDNICHRSHREKVAAIKFVKNFFIFRAILFALLG